MELRELKYFLMVAREENITKAANLLHITQPTLSRQMMQLEEELGVKLFERGKYRVTLTEDGMLLRRRAQEIVDLSEKTVQELSHNEDMLAGEIVIGCGETLNMAVVAEQIASFQKEYPLVRFQIHSSTADDIKERLEKGLLDIGLLCEPVDISKYEFLRMPYKEKWGAVVCKDSPLAQKEEIKPEDLLAVPLIMPQRSEVQNELSNWFGENYENLNVAATFNLINNATIMVANKVGVAIGFDLGGSYDDVSFIPLAGKLEAGAVLVWKKSQMHPAATAKFIQHLKYAI